MKKMKNKINQVLDMVWEQTDESVHAQAIEQVTNQVRYQIRIKVGDQIDALVANKVFYQVKIQVVANNNPKFWEGVKKSAENVIKGPDWLKAGIVLNPSVYETYPPENK